MKSMFKYLLVLSAFAVASVGAMAQTQLKVSTGSATGTYARMFKELNGMCKDAVMQIEMPSKGAVENMDRLLGNEVNAGIVQTDVLFYRARSEDLSGIKTLFALHPEEVHVIAPVISPITEGGTLGMGKKAIALNRIEDLTSRSIAAWGGSVVTAQVIRLQSEVNFQVVEVADFKAAKQALDAGQVAALLMVGGQPMADVSALPNTYKLLSFSEASIGKLKSVYVPAKITYSNMGQAGSGVQTIATEALYVTRAYKTPKYVESLAALRTCFKENLSELQETTGMHKKWSAVKADNTGKWSYYELPAGTVKPVASVAAPAKKIK
jgi:TRAP-type uncharacterized transport system substrate-binding protein